MIKQLQNYIKSSITNPFFLYVGDEKYLSFQADLLTNGFTLKKISDFCTHEDKLPNIDDLYNYIKENQHPKIAIIGLGEYLALRGEKEIFRTISELKDISLNTSKLVFLLRGIPIYLDTDPRFDNYRYAVVGDMRCDISILQTDIQIENEEVCTIKSLLSELENGRTGEILVKTDIQLDDSLFPVKRIKKEHISTTVKLAENDVRIDYQNGIEVKLIFNKPVGDISAIYDKTTYSAIKNDEMIYRLSISEIKKAGTYNVAIYENEALVGTVKIKAHGKAGKINDDFDF